MGEPEDGDGFGRRVEDASGSVLGRAPGDDASSSVIGSPRGGPYAVPDTTVRTPYQHSITADPVASAHAPR